jgi:hypothetical protein
LLGIPKTVPLWWALGNPKEPLGTGARGKSGGVRVIYYYYNPDMPIFLLTVFAKNERDDVSQREKNILKQLVTELVRTYEAKKTQQHSR